MKPWICVFVFLYWWSNQTKHFGEEINNYAQLKLRYKGIVYFTKKLEVASQQLHVKIACLITSMSLFVVLPNMLHRPSLLASMSVVRTSDVIYSINPNLDNAIWWPMNKINIDDTNMRNNNNYNYNNKKKQTAIATQNKVCVPTNLLRWSLRQTHTNWRVDPKTTRIIRLPPTWKRSSNAPRIRSRAPSLTSY